MVPCPSVLNAEPGERRGDEKPACPQYGMGGCASLGRRPLVDAWMADEFFDEVAPFLPAEKPVGKRGGRLSSPHRIVVTMIWFVLVTGCRWDRVAAVQNGGVQPCSSLGGEDRRDSPDPPLVRERHSSASYPGPSPYTRGAQAGSSRSPRKRPRSGPKYAGESGSRDDASTSSPRTHRARR